MDYSSVVSNISPSIAKIYSLDSQGNVISTGSAFLYLKKGILVTCDHVVERSNAFMCRFGGPSGAIHSAKIAMRDQEHDLALLKIEVDIDPLMPLDAELAKNICAGMPVLFSGYPLNLDTLTTHQGILSAITRDAVGIETYLIDGTVNSGNSGCPLMNDKGEVIGVVNAKGRARSELLNKVEAMSLGAVSLYGIDLVEIYQALISNVQLGVGYAVPASYIPEHKQIAKEIPKPIMKEPDKKSTDEKDIN